MKNYKLNFILCLIGIIIISLFMVYSTYAYFTIDVDGEGKEIELTTFDKNTTIIYNDTSNVSMVNAYTGDEIIKTFTVENTSELILYYDILFNNVVNNFENKEDLVYTLESNDAAKREVSILPSENEAIATDIIIYPHEKHEYTMTITFLKKKSDQSANMNKTFSSNIKVEGSKSINVGEIIYKSESLLKTIIKESEAEETNVYYTNNSINGKPIYYYKGNDINNNLVYNNMCFKIIRTDENYNIRAIYNGEYIDGVCSSENYIGKTKFNTKNNSNAYVGYMFGTSGSNSYNIEHNNINSSNIKIMIDEWYKEKFNNDQNIAKNSIYCNNRVTSSFSLKGVTYSKNGYGKSNTGYFNKENGIYSFDCKNTNDRFSLNNEESNKKLNYPVGLITADEILYSGENSYLLSGNYWTMTPAYYNGSYAYNYVVYNGSLLPAIVTGEAYVRPVISLDKDVTLINGSGTILEPYMISR